MKAIVIAALLGAVAFAEPDDTWQGATSLQGFGCAKLDASGDIDWWRIRRDHAAAVALYVDTGMGCLCACPQGDPFILSLEVYDASGALLFSHAGTSPGLSILPLSGLPLGQPVWLRVTGVTVGPAGWSPYRLLVF